MSGPQHPVPNAFDYEGCVTAGRATGKPIPPPSDEDLRRAEEAWNDPAFYNLWQNEPFVGPVWVPKPAVDPNRSLLPSAGDLANVPRWARIAFAARCAARVFPLVKRVWVNVPVTGLQAVSDAIRTTENAAALQTTRASTAASTAVADAVAYATQGAWVAGREASTTVQKVMEIAVTGVRAANSAAGAEIDFARAVRDSGLTQSATDADAAAFRLCTQVTLMTFELLSRVSTIGTVGHLAALARDFDRLLTSSQKENWTDGTPVPPSVFGPMWEGTPPDWWTEEPLAELLSSPNGEGHAAPTSDAVAPH